MSSRGLACRRAVSSVKVWYGSHGTEVARSDWSRSVKVGSVMVGKVRSLAWQVISQINRKENQRNGSF
jgi:hypothetical protein